MRITFDHIHENQSKNRHPHYNRKQSRNVLLYFFFIIILGWFLSKGSIHAGFLLDDLIQRRIYLIHDLFLSLLKTFSFIDVSNVRWLTEHGQIPWWSHPSLKISFFRPVAVLTHYLDYSFWPRSPELMHLQSIFWFLIVCSLVLVYYEKIFKSWKTAFIATYLFTTDFNHFTSIAWLADRNRLVALFFGISTLLMHRLWMNTTKGLYRFLALLLFITTLLSSESGVAVLGFVVAYSIFSINSDIKRLIPIIRDYLGVFALWLIIYTSLGYGVVNTGLYTSPIGDPITYVGAMIERVPILFIEQMFKPSMFVHQSLWSWPDPSLYNLLGGPEKVLYWMGSMIAIYLLWKVFHKILRKEELTKYFACSTLTALFFASTTKIIDGRLLIFVGLGTSGLLASLLNATFKRKNEYFSHPLIWVFTILLVLQGLVSPIKLYENFNSKESLTEKVLIFTQVDNSTDGRLRFVINAPSVFYGAYSPYIFGSSFLNQPQFLVPSTGTLVVKRLNEHSLQISIRKKRMMWSFTDRINESHLYADLDTTFNRFGTQTKLGYMRVNNYHVIAVKPHPKSNSSIFIFQFDKKLSHRSYSWYTWSWQKRRYEIFFMPKIGEEVVIPASKE